MNYNNRISKNDELVRNTLNQPTKVKTKNWFEINDESREKYNTNSQIRFQTSMLNYSLCDYSNAYILVKGTITVTNTGTAAAPNNSDEKVGFKNRVQKQNKQYANR